MKSPAKLFFGLIGKRENIEALRGEIEKFGSIDAKSEIIPFNFTDYYEKEMGKHLKRQWVSTEIIIEENSLKDVKKRSIEIEDRYRDSDKRIINIDPGGILLSRVVLPTTKNYAHRIYLGDNIFIEVTLVYKDKLFQPLPWTYPDYKTETALRFFNKMREKLKSQVIVENSEKN